MQAAKHKLAIVRVKVPDGQTRKRSLWPGFLRSYVMDGSFSEKAGYGIAILLIACWAAICIAAIRLPGSALPVPAISYAVP